MHRKKILALSLVLALSLALCACGESGGNDTADQAGPLSGGTWTEQPDGSTDPHGIYDHHSPGRHPGGLDPTGGRHHRQPDPGGDPGG